MRLPDWPQRMAEAIEARRGKPFAWSAQDCATFAASVVQAMTGVDPMADYRGRYGSALQAARLVRAGGGLRRLAGERLGAEYPATLARRGDVVLLDGEAPALGVCIGDKAAFVGPEGLVFVKLRACAVAWRV